MTATALVQLPLYSLAREINDAHAAVKYHAKGMLLEAKRAGEALLKVKQECPHGSFKAWVECETQVGYRRAMKYMRVAKLASEGNFDPDLWPSIDGFLDAHAERQPNKAKATPTFTQDDAEYALKIHALVERGEGGEAEVAKSKLDSFAKQFGMTGEEVVEKATEVKPAPNYETDKVDEFLNKHFGKLSKPQLMEVIAYCMAEHPDLISKIVKKD